MEKLDIEQTMIKIQQALNGVDFLTFNFEGVRASSARMSTDSNLNPMVPIIIDDINNYIRKSSGKP